MVYSLKAFKYIRFKDILHLFLAAFILPWALIAKIFIRDFWLICEEKYEARDNGYWLYKWIRENKPKQKVAYAINKKSYDYEKVKPLGKIISYGTLSHWFWYIVADKNISSQKGGKPNAAVCYLFEVVFKMRKNNRIFLQHGVIMNDLKWLYYDKCYFNLFCCSAKPEYEYVSKNFGYPEGIVQCVGLARFDGLHDETVRKRQILVMPTWREYLVRPHGTVSEHDLKNQFPDSIYFKKWSEFLCSDFLQTILSDNNYTLLFYPHRNIQRYLDNFRALNLGNNVKIANPDELSVQSALKESACLITDYSSVFFDFAYMKKPIVFYQFDEEEFRHYQYEKGYFDYHNNPLGEWSGELTDCLNLLHKQISLNCPDNDRVSEFFDIYDSKNCERTYNAIIAR